MCSKCSPPASTHDLTRSRHWSIVASITFCSKSTQVCVRHFCRSQMSQIFVLYTHCCTTPKFYNLQVHFDEAYMMHLMRFSSVICHCNITFSLFRRSQGSVATWTGWVGWNSYRHMYRSKLNLTLKTALKFVDFAPTLVGSFLWLTG